MKNFLKKNKSNIIFIIVSALIFILFILSFVLPLIPKEEKTEVIEKEETVEKKNEEDNKVFLVDIKGQIKGPGVYEMKSGERVNDVIKKAGGLTEKADTSLINLSQKIKDEMVIIVYSKEEVIKMTEEEPCVCPEVNNACINDEDKAEIVASEDEVTTNGKVSINEATKEELMTLEGIGAAKADSIIEYRNKNGKFKTIEDIKNVSGIGESVFEKIKNSITV